MSRIGFPIVTLNRQLQEPEQFSAIKKKHKLSRVRNSPAFSFEK